MALSPHTRFGPYEIAESIGAGGMGEVYRAIDTNLKRDVAIKVLPESFARDADRLARFQREAEVLALLNHMNIAHIYGLERGDSTTALVMEFIEGPTLADRITQGPVPADEALNIAMQIADALEAAHEQGIVHRDLKPANIKLRPDGTVKVLDFGIAKALDTRTPSGPQALTIPAMTQAGAVLGTAAYMSPEQARGKQVDQRADIWAFGCVLYEMLSGQRAFGGEEAPIPPAREPERGVDMNSLPPMVSPAVRQTLQLCLHRNLKKRVADIRDVRLALEGAFVTAASQTPSSATSSTTRERLGWIAFAVALLVAIALAIPTVRHMREAPPPETRVEIATPATDNPGSFALSPDGRQIVFAASGDGASRLWLRSLATTTAQPLAGTEDASDPFWAPDSRAIGFFAGGALKRLDLGGGAPQTLAPAPASRGGTWNADDVILFAPNGISPLMRVSATGGSVTAVTTLGPQQQSHRYPHALPDRGRFLFYSQGPPDTAGIYLIGFDGSASTRLTPADGAGVYLPSGWLLWVRAGTLVAQRLNVAQAAILTRRKRGALDSGHIGRSHGESRADSTGSATQWPRNL